MNTKLLLIAICLFAVATAGFSQNLDLTNSKIICLEKDDPLVLKSVSILQEEIEKRKQDPFGYNQKMA